MSSRLRLAYLADPNSVHTRRWLEAFIARGHEVHLLVGTTDAVREGLHAEIRLHRYPRFGRRRLPFVSSLQGRRSLRRALRAIGPDVLHAHYLTRHGWQGRLSSFRPFVVSPWGSDLFVTPRESLRARFWARLTLRGADVVTVVSQAMRRAVRAHGVPDDRIVDVAFGVDTAALSPARVRDPRPVLDRVNLRGCTRFVFSPRAIAPLYRPDVVLAAVARLPGDTAVVMTARNADPALLAVVRRRVDDLRLTDRVAIVDDIADDLMLELFRHAAAIVSVPESDAIPISVLEAMAVGQPVVATDLAGPRELLAAHEPELIVPVGDVIRTAAALERALGMTDGERERLASRLRAAVVRNADRETNMDRMEGVYRRLAGIQ